MEAVWRPRTQCVLHRPSSPSKLFILLNFEHTTVIQSKFKINYEVNISNEYNNLTAYTNLSAPVRTDIRRFLVSLE